jgi:hypothetical protein
LAHAFNRPRQAVDQRIDQVGGVDVGIVGQGIGIGNRLLESQTIGDQSGVRQEVLARDQPETIALDQRTASSRALSSRHRRAARSGVSLACHSLQGFTHFPFLGRALAPSIAIVAVEDARRKAAMNLQVLYQRVRDWLDQDLQTGSVPAANCRSPGAGSGRGSPPGRHDRHQRQRAHDREFLECSRRD